MKKLALLAFSFLAHTILFATSNPSYAISNIPDSLQENAHTVIRLEVQDFEVQSPTKAIERNRYIVSVLNSQSYMKRILFFYDGFNKVKRLNCTVYDAFGQVLKSYKQKEFSDRSAVSGSSLYSDSRVKYLDLNQFSTPFTIEYSYEMTHEQGFSAYPHWQQHYGEAIEKTIISCTLPDELDIQYRTSKLDIQPQKSEDYGKQKYSWLIQNLPAQERLELSPPMYEVLPILQITPNKFKIEGYEGSYTTWANFGDFVSRINADRDELSPTMVSEIQTLTKDLSSDAEKVNVLYDYLQENTRYVSVQIGIGGWQTYDASYVERNNYGDCKALSNYMKSMLKAAGVESNLVLINAGRPSFVVEDFPIQRFNHMILYVPSEDMWLECTSKGYPAGYFGSNNADRKVLLIDGTDSQLRHLPPIENNVANHQVLIALDEKGTALFQKTSHYTGEQHEPWRSYQTYYASKEDIIKDYRIKSTLPSFRINAFEIEVSDTIPEATHIADFEIPKYASKAGKRFFVPINRWSAFKNLLPEDDNRQIPVVRRTAYTDEMDVTIQLPENYVIESMPATQTIDSPYGRYELSITQKDEQVLVKRKLVIKRLQLDASVYEAVRAFYKEISKLDNAQMVLKREE